MDPKSKTVLEKWSPVLYKLTEFRDRSLKELEVVAQILENQLVVSGHLLDFTRFVLPLVRRVLKRLFDLGVSIEPVLSKEGTVSTILPIKLPPIPKEPDHEAEDKFLGEIADMLVDHIMRECKLYIRPLVVGNIYRPWVIVAPNNEQNEQKLSGGVGFLTIYRPN